jgi:hypothetical protein
MRDARVHRCTVFLAAGSVLHVVIEVHSRGRREQLDHFSFRKAHCAGDEA